MQKSMSLRCCRNENLLACMTTIVSNRSCATPYDWTDNCVHNDPRHCAPICFKELCNASGYEPENYPFCEKTLFSLCCFRCWLYKLLNFQLSMLKAIFSKHYHFYTSYYRSDLRLSLWIVCLIWGNSGLSCMGLLGTDISPVAEQENGSWSLILLLHPNLTEILKWSVYIQMQC